MENISHEQAYHQMQRMLNEKQWRQYLAVEAKQRGSVSLVAREAGVSLNTVKRGLTELEAGESYQPGERIRKVGGGKKKVMETDATLLADLEQELEPKGDPMSLVRWTSKSLAHLVEALEAKGHGIKKSALAEVLYCRTPSRLLCKGRDTSLSKCIGLIKQGNEVAQLETKRATEIMIHKKSRKERSSL